MAINNPARDGDLVEAAAKALGLVVVLLPFSGAVLRWFAFTFGEHLSASSSKLAWSASPFELIATGLIGLLVPGGIYILMAVLYFWIDTRRGPAPKDRLGPRQQRVALIIWSPPVLVAISLLYLLTAGPVLLIVGAAGAVAGYLGVRIGERPGPFRLVHYWPIVAIGVLASAVASGLGGNLPGLQAGDYRFTSPTSIGLSNGRYVELGQSDSLIYLVDCSGSGKVVAVPQIAIQAVGLLDNPQPPPRTYTSSPLEAFINHTPFGIGFHATC